MLAIKKYELPSIKTIVATAASISGTIMVMRSIARDIIPEELQEYLLLKTTPLFSLFSFTHTLIIEEYEGLNQNQLFRAAQLYLAAIKSPRMNRFRVSLPKKEDKIVVSMDKNQEVTDTFNGVDFNWRYRSKKTHKQYVTDPDCYDSSSYKSEDQCFELSFHKKHMDFVFDTYFPYVLNKSKELEEDKKTIKLFTLRSERGGYGKPWVPVKLDHPANFDTLAMDSEIKKTIMDDLQRFVGRREYYRRVGKAWKRGYLLFGPPGTGKSSLIAAMANYLNFDIYDLELTSIRHNSDLRKLLITTANKSILVVEDIDCSIEFHKRTPQAQDKTLDPYRFEKSQITLSGFLNFIDGLWSSCGDERIIVFTTNHKERLDPALLRPGRMDVHVFMSYCTPSGFKQLASNYLGITDHPLFLEVEKLIEMKKATPAEVGEQLMKNEDPDVALTGLIEFLREKKETTDEAKAGEVVVLRALEAEAEGKSKEQNAEDLDTTSSSEESWDE